MQGFETISRNHSSSLKENERPQKDPIQQQVNRREVVVHQHHVAIGAAVPRRIGTRCRRARSCRRRRRSAEHRARAVWRPTEPLIHLHSPNACDVSRRPCRGGEDLRANEGRQHMWSGRVGCVRARRGQRRRSRRSSRVAPSNPIMRHRGGEFILLERVLASTSIMRLYRSETRIEYSSTPLGDRVAQERKSLPPSQRRVDLALAHRVLVVEGQLRQAPFRVAARAPLRNKPVMISLRSLQTAKTRATHGEKLRDG